MGLGGGLGGGLCLGITPHKLILGESFVILGLVQSVLTLNLHYSFNSTKYLNVMLSLRNIIPVAKAKGCYRGPGEDLNLDSLLKEELCGSEAVQCQAFALTTDHRFYF